MTARTLKSALVAILFVPLVAGAGELVPQSWELADEAHAFFAPAAEASPAAPIELADACIDASHGNDDPLATTRF